MWAVCVCDQDVKHHINAISFIFQIYSSNPEVDALKCYTCLADTIEDCNRTQLLEYCSLDLYYPSCFTVSYKKTIKENANQVPVVRTVVQKKCGSQLNGCIYECKLHKMLGAGQCFVSLFQPPYDAVSTFQQRLNDVVSTGLL